LFPICKKLELEEEEESSSQRLKAVILERGVWKLHWPFRNCSKVFREQAVRDNYFTSRGQHKQEKVSVTTLDIANTRCKSFEDKADCFMTSASYFEKEQQRHENS
jgi:hypothetical protein